MWNRVQSVGRMAYTYVTPTSWNTPHQQQLPPPKSVLNTTVVTILKKITPWDTKGYIKKVLAYKSEEAAVAYFSTILVEDAFGTMLEKGRHVLGASEQSTLIAFFAQMADKYPKYNLCAAVTSIIVQLG